MMVVIIIIIIIIIMDRLYMMSQFTMKSIKCISIDKNHFDIDSI